VSKEQDESKQGRILSDEVFETFSRNGDGRGQPVGAHRARRRGGEARRRSRRRPQHEPQRQPQHERQPEREPTGTSTSIALEASAIMAASIAAPGWGGPIA